MSYEDFWHISLEDGKIIREGIDVILNILKEK